MAFLAQAGEAISLKHSFVAGLAFLSALILASPGQVTAQNTVPKKPPLAELEKLCAADENPACEELRVRFGRMPEMRKEYAHFTKRSCETGTARQCTAYASRMIISSKGFPPNNPNTALKYAFMGCKGGDALGCGLAVSLERNNNILGPVDESILFNKTCEIGKPQDCAVAAETVSQRGRNGHALLLAKKACAKGHTSTCTKVPAYQARSDAFVRGLTRPQNSVASTSAAPGRSAQPVQRAPQPAFRGKSNARSGTRSCTKSNGGQGKQYWYYGFDNKKKYGPCV
jgi:hypothetical protein